MKTAMQELIDNLESIDIKIPNGVKLIFIEKEKQQIADAFVECWKANMPDGFECKLSAKDYYNQTYSQDRELPKDVTDLLENYKKDKTFKQKSKWI